MTSNAKEIWKDVVGYEGLYEVSNLGNVRSVDFQGKKRIRLLKQATIGDGYLHVNLCKNGVHKTGYTHRLVAQAFISNPERKPVVDHINTIRTDNRLENLRWVTQRENVNHPITHKRNADAQHYKAVCQYSLSGILITEFKGIRIASRETNTNRVNISKCCKGMAKSAGGYIWKYKNEQL